MICALTVLLPAHPPQAVFRVMKNAKSIPAIFH
jgi:hypothetical protein